MIKGNINKKPGAITNHPTNGKCYGTNRSINSKIDSPELIVQQIEISHGEQAVFLFETFGEIRGTCKTRIKCYLSYSITLSFHQFSRSFKSELF